MTKGGGGVQTPPKMHDIINEQPLSGDGGGGLKNSALRDI